MAGEAPPCPVEGCPARMDYIPGEITLGPEGIQLKKVYCPLCGYFDAENTQGNLWWAPSKVTTSKCTACGNVDEVREYFRGGATDVPTAAPESVSVDQNGFAHGLGIQGIPLGG